MKKIYFTLLLAGLSPALFAQSKVDRPVARQQMKIYSENAEIMVDRPVANTSTKLHTVDVPADSKVEFVEHDNVPFTLDRPKNLDAVGEVKPEN